LLQAVIQDIFIHNRDSITWVSMYHSNKAWI
jgi:hypothetical protein